MALKPINGQYTNTNNIIRTYSAGGKYFVAFKGGLEIELKGDNAQTGYETLSAYCDKINTGECVCEDIINETYQIGESSNYKYYLEFANGQKVEYDIHRVMSVDAPYIYVPNWQNFRFVPKFNIN